MTLTITALNPHVLRIANDAGEAVVCVRDAGRAVEIAQEEVSLRKRHLHLSYPTDDQSSPWVEVSVDGVTAANLLDTLDFPFDAFDLSVEDDRLRVSWGNRTPTFRLVALLPDLISTLTAASLISDREGSRVLRLR